VLAPFDTDPYGSARARMPYPLLSRPLSPSQSSLNIPRHMLLLCPLSSPTHPIKQQQGDSNFTHLTVPQPSSLDAFRSAQPDLFSRRPTVGRVRGGRARAQVGGWVPFVSPNFPRVCWVCKQFSDPQSSRTAMTWTVIFSSLPGKRKPVRWQT